MSPVLPFGALLSDEAEVGLVDEGGAFEGVLGALLQHLAAGDLAQLLVDERGEFVEGFAVAGGPAFEEAGDVFGCGVHGCRSMDDCERSGWSGLKDCLGDCAAFHRRVYQRPVLATS